MKDLIILYKVYLQTLLNIRDGNEVAGDIDTLKILRKELDEACSKKRIKK